MIVGSMLGPSHVTHLNPYSGTTCSKPTKTKTLGTMTGNSRTKLVTRSDSSIASTRARRTISRITSTNSNAPPLESPDDDLLLDCLSCLSLIVIGRGVSGGVVMTCRWRKNVSSRRRLLPIERRHMPANRKSCDSQLGCAISYGQRYYGYCTGQIIKA
mmetsp:Transcript_18819/g.43188  ORF Transcript_18819/g.43188 Transcript_18819/m.43188 type:complete len:158 (-) Transcript_18819:19-492(-)